MEIGIIGGTGRIGKRIAEYAVQRGHHVKVYSRHPERNKIQGVCAVKGDTSDIASLERFAENQDVIINTTTVFRGNPSCYVAGVDNVMKAVKEVGVPRLIIANHYCTSTINGEEVRAMFALPQPFNKIIPFYRESLAHIRREQELDWLVVTGPAFMVPYYDVTGKYKILESDEMIIPDPRIGPQSSKISMEDFAYFILLQTEKPMYSKTRITVCNPHEIWH